MADITFNTNTAQYQKFLDRLEALKTTLAPQIQMLKICHDRGEDGKVRWLLQNDLLLRRVVKMMQELADFLDLEIEDD